MAKNYLQRRGTRFYFRMKVPVDLRDTIGHKEIKVSLGTSDFKEASRMVKLEAFKAETRFAEERRKAVQRVAPKAAKVMIGEGEALGLVAKWYAKREQDSEEWLEENLSIFQRPDDLQDALQTLYMDEHAYSGGGLVGDALAPPATGEGILEEILEESGVKLNLSGEAAKRLAGAVRKACLEGIRRDIRRLQQKRLGGCDQIFSHGRKEHSHGDLIYSTASGSQGQTLGKLLDEYMSEQKKVKRAESTLRTYQAPVRLLREELGESLPVEQIDRSKMVKVRDLILLLPANATKLYPGKSLREASELAKVEGRPPIEPKTAENYFRNITAIFNFAVDAEMITKSPVSGRLLKRSFETKSGKKRPVFTSSTLRPLLLALSNHPDSKAPEVKRDSGRFWVPLLGLLQGFRLNEACQIYTEDVSEKDGVLCIEIRDSREDGTASEKRLKNRSSARIVPVHPWLLEIGFRSYVEKRRKDARNPRLFADLTRGQTGYFSDPFQKWFKRFLVKALGEPTKLSFHCFRHTWRDALRAARISSDVAKRLGGWTNGREVESFYGENNHFALLLEDLAKVTFPGLEIVQPRAKAG